MKILILHFIDFSVQPSICAKCGFDFTVPRTELDTIHGYQSMEKEWNSCSGLTTFSSGEVSTNCENELAQIALIQEA